MYLGKVNDTVINGVEVVCNVSSSRRRVFRVDHSVRMARIDNAGAHCLNTEVYTLQDSLEIFSG